MQLLQALSLPTQMTSHYTAFDPATRNFDIILVSLIE